MNVSAPPEPKPQRPAQAPPADVKLHAAQTNQAAAQALGVLPQGILDPAEIILMVVKPSAWMIALDAARTLLIVGCLTFLALRMLPQWFENLDDQLIYAISASIISAKVFWIFMGWVWRVYVLTDKRVIVISGVRKLHIHERPLNAIQGIQVHDTFIEKLFGLGTLGFTLTGETRQLLWRSVARPMETAKEAWRLVERYSR
jgi:uncharacterized membrane protein YdbT with pleckstrin-like domain